MTDPIITKRLAYEDDLNLSQADGGPPEYSTEPSSTGAPLTVRKAHGGMLPWTNEYTRTIRPGVVVTKSPWIDVRAFSDSLTDAAVQAAIDGASDGDTVVIPRASYVFSNTVVIDKAITLKLMGTQIAGPAGAYAFQIQSNDATIIGKGNAIITLNAASGSGGIWNDQSMRTRYRDFNIDMNSSQNAIGFFHDGGWYVNVKNVHIEKVKCHSTSEGIVIKGTSTGVIGPRGTWGGSFVSHYENIVSRTVRCYATWDIGHTILTKVTTITFVNLDAEAVILADTLAITFLQPVIQTDGGGVFWDLNNTANTTIMGGDMEGVGTTVFKFTASNNGVNSIGNYVSGAGNIYFDGFPGKGCYFADDCVAADTDGFFRGYYGQVQSLGFRNSGYDVTGRIGHSYQGNIIDITNNINRDSVVGLGTLDDDSLPGVIISLDASGRFIFSMAYAGTNPVTVFPIAQFDNGGILMPMVYAFADNAAAIAGGLAVGRFYRKTGTGDVCVVY